MNVTVREAAEGDFFGWLPLFETHCANRGGRLDDAKALIVWSWAQDPAHALRAGLAVDGAGAPVGLVHFHVEPRTIDASIALVIDDLYVQEGAQGTGVEDLLLAYVRESATGAHATRIVWSHAPDEADALSSAEAGARRRDAVVFEADL
ncbi:GNAT family N-acetyltransferase [Agromyces marinus]|uniref:N-acetyltransferase domain-containing protein n=1 Tax=Agromyces marinus TaxID=1389020 RepID=A0ABM8GX62_9MICO|nr:GNAT family N-acetyltransferase [Agromyces marinus]UIP58687.1 hypothetical protein DSM26151_15670 [Agromyces marinus]BDZ53017.1 hypothetical protein GCM10025870_00900 [Agromyces marinus]